MIGKLQYDAERNEKIDMNSDVFVHITYEKNYNALNSLSVHSGCKSLSSF